MDKKRLTSVVREEFSRMKGLYNKSDKIKVNPTSSERVFRYVSSKYTKKIEDDLLVDMGLTHMEFLINTEKSLAWIGNVVVNKLYRGRGFGRLMVETIESICKKSRVDPIIIQNSYNDPFWEHLGYSTISNRMIGKKQ